VPKVVIRKGRHEGREYAVGDERLVLGRRRTCGVPIADPQASREHAEIVREGSRYYVRDLGSRNGTFHNDRRIEGEIELKSGGRIRIGGTVIEFVDEEEGAAFPEISGYELLERIGRGGMGTVYRARQVSMDRVVALKVLGDKFARNGEFIDRFIREARSAGRLNHPNVIHVHDVSHAGGIYFFSMEYIDGKTVKDLLRERGRLPVQQACDITLQAAKALEFSHENGIIHRDIKPDNIMLTSEGIVKIADLGIAKRFDDREEAALAPGKRRVLGTPHYMSPEQALGQKLDGRADLYSLGATFYHMLTGATPFAGTKITDILHKHVHERLQPIQSLNADVPDQVCFIVERMMAKRPDKRYESMTRLIEDLSRARAGEEAPIERIAAEDSTIMHVIEANALERRRVQHDAGEEGTPARRAVLVVLGVLALVAVAVAAYLVLAWALAGGHGGGGEDAGGTEGTGSTEPAASAAAELLDQAKVQRARGLQSECVATLNDLLARFGESPEAGEARAILADIERLRREGREREADAQRALVAAWVREHPDDPKGARVRWAQIVRDFAGTKAAERATSEVAAIDATFAEHAAAEAREAWNTYASTARTALRSKDYDKAIGAYRGFVAAYEAPRFAADALVEKARAEIARLEAEIGAIFDETLRKADRLKDQEQWAEAVATVQSFIDTYAAATRAAKAKARIAEIEKACADLLAEGLKPIEAGIASGRHEEAERLARALLRRFRRTAHEAKIRAAIERIGRLRMMLPTAVDAIQRGGSRPLNFAPEVKLPGKGKWRVKNANAETVSLTMETIGGVTLGHTSRWEKLSPKDTYRLWRLYLTEPDRETHLMLAEWCALKGLAAEAETHRKAAAEIKE